MSSSELVGFSMPAKAELDALRGYWPDVDKVAALPKGQFVAINRDSGAERSGKLF